MTDDERQALADRVDKMIATMQEKDIECSIQMRFPDGIKYVSSRGAAKHIVEGVANMLAIIAAATPNRCGCDRCKTAVMLAGRMSEIYELGVAEPATSARN